MRRYDQSPCANRPREALAPGAATVGQSPGLTSGGSCIAYFYANPDLTVAQVGWTMLNGTVVAQATIKNLSNFATARPSVTKIEQVQCVNTTLSSKEVATPSIPKGGSVVVSVAMPKGSNQYLRATANPNGVLIESNRNNNLLTSPEANNPSCIPH